MTASARRGASSGAGAAAGDSAFACHPSASGLNEADRAAVAEKLALATGGAAPHHAWHLMVQLAAASGGAPGAGETGAGEPATDGAAGVLAALEAAMALAPRDPLEGMLVSQMAAVNAAALRCLGRAAACAGDVKGEALYLREAVRLLHLFQRQAETLDRRSRRLGPPKQAKPAAEAAQAAQGASAGREPDGAEILDNLIAGIYARRRAAAGVKATDMGDRGPDLRGGDPPMPWS